MQSKDDSSSLLLPTQDDFNDTGKLINKSNISASSSTSNLKLSIDPGKNKVQETLKKYEIL